LGSKNIYGYNFSSDGMRSSAIKPPVNTFVFVGWFISFGTDKTQEALIITVKNFKNSLSLRQKEAI
jgi:hypothetical protein